MNEKTGYRCRELAVVMEANEDSAGSSARTPSIYSYASETDSADRLAVSEAQASAKPEGEAGSRSSQIVFDTDSDGEEEDPLTLPNRAALYAARYAAIMAQPGLRDFEPRDAYVELGFTEELEGLRAKQEEASDTMSPELREAIHKELTVYGGSGKAEKAARDAANEVAGDLGFLAAYHASEETRQRIERAATRDAAEALADVRRGAHQTCRVVCAEENGALSAVLQLLMCIQELAVFYAGEGYKACTGEGYQQDKPCSQALR